MVSLALKREKSSEELPTALANLLRAKEPDTGRPFGFKDFSLNVQSLLYSSLVLR